MRAWHVHILRQADTFYYIRYVAFKADGEEIFSTRPDRSWAPPSLLHNWYRGIPGDKAAGAWP
jgi:hypothetical protein